MGDERSRTVSPLKQRWHYDEEEATARYYRELGRKRLADEALSTVLTHARHLVVQHDEFGNDLDALAETIGYLDQALERLMDTA